MPTCHVVPLSHCVPLFLIYKYIREIYIIYTNNMIIYASRAYRTIKNSGTQWDTWDMRRRNSIKSTVPAFANVSHFRKNSGTIEKKVGQSRTKRGEMT